MAQHREAQERNQQRVITWVEETVRLMVDDERAVQISVVKGSHNLVFEVRCAEADKRHIIGAGGAMSESIRRMLNTVCKKTGIKYSFDVL